MKYSFTYYFVQLKIEKEDPIIICHSKDEETGGLYHKFLNKKEAVKLKKNEKKLSPEKQYRIVKCVENFHFDEWS